MLFNYLFNRSGTQALSNPDVPPTARPRGLMGTAASKVNFVGLWNTRSPHGDKDAHSHCTKINKSLRWQCRWSVIFRWLNTFLPIIDISTHVLLATWIFYLWYQCLHVYICGQFKWFIILGVCPFDLSMHFFAMSLIHSF